MGYEQKFFIVDNTTTKGLENPDKSFAQVIAMYDNCKDDRLSHFVNTHGKDSNCFIFADDGNTEVVEDEYGKPMKEIDIDLLIEYLEEHTDDYRRYGPFLALLKAFQGASEDFRDLKILRFGY